MTGDEPQRTGERRSQVLTAAAIGGVAGAALTAHRGGQAAGLGAAAGAAVLAASEAVARARQRPGEIPRAARRGRQGTSRSIWYADTDVINAPARTRSEPLTAPR